MALSLDELGRVERHIARRARMRGLGTGSPITSFTDDQVNQTTALMAIAWALLDAESRGDRPAALSLVPVFVASWNAWSGGVRRIYVNAPASLSATGPWTSSHDTALTLVLATYMWMQQRTDAQIHQMLGSFPTGAVPNAYRGTWFITQVSGQFTAPIFARATSTFRSSGAAGLSSFADSVSRGVDPTVAASPVSSAPPVPSEPAPRTSRPVELPGMTITGSGVAPSRSNWGWWALGGAIAIGLGVFAYQRIAA